MLILSLLFHFYHHHHYSLFMQYLIKANEVKVKKGVELVQHLIEYYHAQLQ